MVALRRPVVVAARELLAPLCASFFAADRRVPAAFWLVVPARAFGAPRLSTKVCILVRAALARMGAVPAFLRVIFRAGVIPV